MYSQKGASASAVLYSIVEAAKANNLIVNDYLEYVLNELAKHANNTDCSFVNALLLWSKTVQKKCRVKNPK